MSGEVKSSTQTRNGDHFMLSFFWTTVSVMTVVVVTSLVFSTVSADSVPAAIASAATKRNRLSFIANPPFIEF